MLGYVKSPSDTDSTYTKACLRDSVADIEAASNGTVLLLIEHKEGGQILRLVPAFD